MSVKHLTPDETAYFCEQLALMLNAGIQLGDGVDMLSEDIGDKRIKEVCSLLGAQLNEGTPLAQAMEQTGVFDKYTVNMVRIGSLTGSLEKVLEGLTEYYEERAEMTRTIRTAVLHPMLLLIMMTVVIIVLVIVVIPMFGEVFAQFDSSVSAAVSGTVDFAYRFGTSILVVLLVVIGVSLAAALASRIQAVKEKLAGFASVFPLTSELSRRFALAKVTKAISVMVSAGTSSDEILENAEALTSDKKIKRMLSGCREKVLAGGGFAEAIGGSGLLPVIYARSLGLAYSAGSFEKAWDKISSRCGEEASRAASSIISFIEPTIIVILATLIGGILLTVMIPLMNIMSVLG